MEDRLSRFEGKIMKRPFESTDLLTEEGAPAVLEAIEFLKNQEAVNALIWDNSLQSSSQDHVLDNGPKGRFSHKGSDGSTPWDRMARYVILKGFSGENIDYGLKDSLSVILNLIIDDGVKDRGHRQNIFNPNYKSVGIYTGYHTIFEQMTVMDYNGF